MRELKIIAFTHKTLPLADVGLLVVEADKHPTFLAIVKEELGIDELFYIATCNRVELIVKCDKPIDTAFIHAFIALTNPALAAEKVNELTEKVAIFEDIDALNHLMRVSSSLESVVVGEKEILAQVRECYENCRKWNLNGDFLRLIMQQVVKAAKEVYGKTKIADKPVSVVSLAYRKLRDLKLKPESRILFIGAGETNQLVGKYLVKHGFGKVTVFNRTLSRAQQLATELNGTAFTLEHLTNYTEGFDVIITCTGATEPIITTDLYAKLLGNDTDKKIILDLAIPTDTHPEVIKNYPLHFIGVEQIQEIAAKNLQERMQQVAGAELLIQSNLEEFMPLLKHRQLTLAMRDIPEKIKEIRHKATNEVFAKELSLLDAASREVLHRVLDYVEKKYIKVPMVMAKEMILSEHR